MLKNYTGPGAAGKDGEVTHRFIGELLDDCEVTVSVPDIDGDKSYYCIARRAPSGIRREVNLQGWDLESVAEDSILERRDCAERIAEDLVRDPDKWNMVHAIENYLFHKEISDRICNAKADVDSIVGERYRKIMYNRIYRQVEKEREDGKDSNSK